MEKTFDPKAKVKQGQFSDASEGKQPNRESMNLDLSQHNRRKGEPFQYDQDVPTKSGSEHVQQSLFKMADEKIINHGCNWTQKQFYTCRSLCRY